MFGENVSVIKSIKQAFSSVFAINFLFHHIFSLKLLVLFECQIYDYEKWKNFFFSFLIILFCIMRLRISSPYIIVVIILHLNILFIGLLETITVSWFHFFFWENNNQVFIIAWLNFDSYYYYGSESNRFCSVVLYNFIEEKKT